MIFGCEQFLVIWVLVVGIFFDMGFFVLVWNFWTHGLRFENFSLTCECFFFFFVAWEIFGTCEFFFLACDFSWNDELNCCVAKPQESR